MTTTHGYARYVACLPEPWRQQAEAVPESTWWRWRDANVHIARARKPAARVRMLILHGGGGHADALWPLAALAAAQGYEVLLPDLPGYGRTDIPDLGGIRYQDWVDCVSDLLRVETANDSRPLVLAGASMGGLLAYSAAARTGLVSHLMATCFLDPSNEVTWPALFRWGGAAALRMLRPLLRRVGPRLGRLRLPLRWLVPMNTISNQPDLNRLCLTDPLGGGNRVQLGFLCSFLFSEPELAPEDFNAPPVTLVHPGADRWTPPAMSLGFFDRIAAPKRYVVLENTGHFPIEEEGLKALVDVMIELREAIKREAATIIEQQIATIATEWASICARAGLTETDHKLLAGRQFLNPCCIEGLTGHQALQDAFLGARNSLVAGGDEC